MSELRKAEYIAKHGEEAYKKKLARKRERARELYKLNQEKMQEKSRRYRAANPEKVKAGNKKYYETHREEEKARTTKYREEHPEKKREYDRRWCNNNVKKVIANHQEACRKGGRRYEKHLEDKRTGLEGARNRIRAKHQTQYRSLKQTIAPASELHHEWVPDTAEYTGVALVDADAHRHGIINVIVLLDGKITLLTEAKQKREEKTI